MTEEEMQNVRNLQAKFGQHEVDESGINEFENERDFKIPDEVVADLVKEDEPIIELTSRQALYKKLESSQNGRNISEIPLNDGYYTILAEINRFENQA